MEIHFEHLWDEDIEITIKHNEHETTFIAYTHITGFPERLINMLVRIWNGESQMSAPLQIVHTPIEIEWSLEHILRITTGETLQASTTLIEFKIERNDLCIAFWNALRELETKVFLGQCEEYLADRIPFRGLDTLSSLIKQDQDKEQS